jgi:hypothetical protein
VDLRFQKEEKKPKLEEKKMEKEIDAFYDGLKDMTANPPVPTQAEALTQLKKQAEEMKAEEDAAIASITAKKEEEDSEERKEEELRSIAWIEKHDSIHKF